MIHDLLNCAIAVTNHLGQPSRSFQLYFSEKSLAYFSILLLSPGDLHVMNGDIADDLE